MLLLGRAEVDVQLHASLVGRRVLEYGEIAGSVGNDERRRHINGGESYPDLVKVADRFVHSLVDELLGDGDILEHPRALGLSRSRPSLVHEHDWGRQCSVPVEKRIISRRDIDFRIGVYAKAERKKDPDRLDVSGDAHEENVANLAACFSLGLTRR